MTTLICIEPYWAWQDACEWWCFFFRQMRCFWPFCLIWFYRVIMKFGCLIREHGDCCPQRQEYTNPNWPQTVEAVNREYWKEDITKQHCGLDTYTLHKNTKEIGGKLCALATRTLHTNRDWPFHLFPPPPSILSSNVRYPVFARQRLRLWILM